MKTPHKQNEDSSFKRTEYGYNNLFPVTKERNSCYPVSPAPGRQEVLVCLQEQADSSV